MCTHRKNICIFYLYKIFTHTTQASLHATLRWALQELAGVASPKQVGGVLAWGVRQNNIFPGTTKNHTQDLKQMLNH
jgi:hypothetical protein